VDYLQQSLLGLSSGVEEYEVATSLATEKTTATLDHMLSEVSKRRRAERLSGLMYCTVFEFQQECFIGREEQALADVEDSATNGIDMMKEVCASPCVLMHIPCVLCRLLRSMLSPLCQSAVLSLKKWQQTARSTQMPSRYTCMSQLA
jgi:hypothetical protein